MQPSEAAYRFSRPANQQTPTRFLFVGKGDLKFNQDSLLDTFSAYGALECVVQPANPRVCFVVFVQVEDAKDAFEAMQDAKARTAIGVNCVKFATAKPIQVNFSHAMKSPHQTHGVMLRRRGILRGSSRLQRSTSASPPKRRGSPALSS